jgi:hypothetical protein
MKSPVWQAVCSATTAVVSVGCMSSTRDRWGCGVCRRDQHGRDGQRERHGRRADRICGLPLLPSLLERIGLGFSNQLPNEVLQPLLAVLLLVSLATAYLAHRGQGQRSALLLTAFSGVVMYLSIYVWMSDLLYVLSLIGLVVGGLWGLYLTRRPARVAARTTGTA